MDRDGLILRLMETFLGEFEERVRDLSQGLLALEKDPEEGERDGLVEKLFRTAHSLKGAARSVDLKPIEQLCHRLEEVLGQVRDGGLRLEPGHFESFFAAVDILEAAGKRLRSKEKLDQATFDRWMARFAPDQRKLAPEAEEKHERKGRWRKPEPEGGAEEAVPEQEKGETRVAEVSFEVPPDSEERVATSAVGSSWVRVPADRLDSLLAQSGELLLARHQIGERARLIDSLHEFVVQWGLEWRGIEKKLPLLGEEATGEHGGRGVVRDQLLSSLVERAGDRVRRMERDLDGINLALTRDQRGLTQAAVGIDDEVRRLRMLPFAGACHGLERVVRDLAKVNGKQVALVVEGDRVELVRSMLEALKDPLLHLVRNAVDHGIESSPERVIAGKPPAGCITVSAVMRGAGIQITVSDDGAGLDLDTIRMMALKKRIAVPEEDNEVARLIFLPGFSTADSITDISGRGVGLDVVASQLGELRASVDVSSEPGRGTRFTVNLPLTLTTLRVLLIRAGGQMFALDGAAVNRVIGVSPKDVKVAEGREVVLMGMAPVIVTSLADILDLPVPESAPLSRKTPAVLVRAKDHEVAFLVDEVLGEQDLVVKNVGRRLRRLRYVSGATILASGEVAFVLNVPELARTARGRRPPSGLTGGPREPGERVKRHLLVVEDSVTARSLIQDVLVEVGYEVTVAVDGAQAWELLQEWGADLVVSDVEMPQMDGFSLTEAIRKSERFNELPVVLVTARATEQEKVRGMQAGANAYLVKSTFDQQSLLQAVEQLL